MRLRKYLALLGVASLVLSFTGCGSVKEPISETEATSVVNSSIVKVNSCQYRLNDALLGDYLESCDIYLDTLTNTCFAKFHSTYNSVSVIVELLDNDGTPKLYSEENTNELVLVEQGNFLVFEDTDTGIQYIITGSYSDYTVRRTDTGELYQ